MAHSSSIFSKVPIEVPNRSGFDMSHENLGTMTTGTLVPVLIDELLPNDTVSLGSNFQVQLPPMATDFFGRVDFVLEAFFVPNRLLWGGWQDFMTHATALPQYPDGTPIQGKSKYLPIINLDDVADGSLSDYLGFKGFDSSTRDLIQVNALPYLAYHRIFDDWYRDSRIQAPLFYRPDTSVSNVNRRVSHQPFVSSGFDSSTVLTETTFADGVDVRSLRQRNWAKDYFTSASPLPQAGNASTLTFDVAADDTGTFSISALRAANSLQKWMERNNIAGYRYSDQIYAQYGIYPSDAIMDRPLYLGRKTQNVYTRSVFQTNRLVAGGSPAIQNNPFANVGAKFGSSQAIGEGSLVDSFRASEHGFLIVLASLVPHAYYSTGVRRYLKRRTVGDFAFPLLAGMGDQAIMKSELYSPSIVVVTGPDGTQYPSDETFAYTDLYAEYKYHDDELHGLLRDGNNIDSFALQRGFESAPELGSEFLQIPTNFLDQVMATSATASGFSCWYDIYFPYKKISTLPEYSLPTLADLKNTHTVHMSRGGRRL